MLRNFVLDVNISGQLLVAQIVGGVGLELNGTVLIAASGSLDLDQTVV